MTQRHAPPRPPSPTVPGAIARPDEIERYAETILTESLAIGAGDRLLIESEPVCRELVAAVAAGAYRRGADVDVTLHDPFVARARLADADVELLGRPTPWWRRRMESLREQRTSLLWIASEEAPGLCADIDPARLTLAATRRAKAARPYSRLRLDGRSRWAIVAWPTPAWAARVYPELSAGAAQRRLLDDLLSFVRAGPDDPPGALKEHLDLLEHRAHELTRRDLRRLELRGPDTALDLVLADGTVWASARDRFDGGYVTAVNLPTEEVFTTPDARGTEGTFRCTRPLSIQGRVIDGIAGEFRSGRLVRLDASRGADRDVLAGVINHELGSDRLGEVALVDASSRIGQRGRVYGDTLLDENQASHIAFGEGFKFARSAAASAASRRTVNSSTIHIDVMIGSPEVDVTATDARGAGLPLIRDGAWQV